MDFLNPHCAIENRLDDLTTLRRIDSIDSTTQKHNEFNKPNKLNKRSQPPRRLKSIRKSGLLLQIQVESKLRLAGIKVLTKEETFNAPGEPYLYININVNIAETEADIYPYSIDLLFIQKVSLQRDPNLTTFAVTWSKGGVGSIGKPILSHLQEYVREMVDIFIKTYLAENPK